LFFLLLRDCSLLIEAWPQAWNIRCRNAMTN
jgi:hypothetical protein